MSDPKERSTICDVGPGLACRSCGSINLGHLCACNNLVCACGPCLTCRDNAEAERDDERARAYWERDQEMERRARWDEDHGY